MPTVLEEAAITGLRAQILGKHTAVSKMNIANILRSDNLRQLKHEEKDPVLTTTCNRHGWTAVVFGKLSGYPIYSTRGGDITVVDALRALLKHTSEKLDATFLEFRDHHQEVTSTGIEFKAVRTLVNQLASVCANWLAVIQSRMLCQTQSRSHGNGCDEDGHHKIEVTSSEICREANDSGRFIRRE
jgi:hypothetical protein